MKGFISEDLVGYVSMGIIYSDNEYWFRFPKMYYLFNLSTTKRESGGELSFGVGVFSARNDKQLRFSMEMEATSKLNFEAVHQCWSKLTR